MDHDCGYDSETILRYMAELNILGSQWLAGIHVCWPSVGVFLANQASSEDVYDAARHLVSSPEAPRASPILRVTLLRRQQDPEAQHHDPATDVLN